jgi:hypothetical protein
MKAKLLPERAPGILVEHDPSPSWPERELIRQLDVKLYGDRWENDR